MPKVTKLVSTKKQPIPKHLRRAGFAFVAILMLALFYPRTEKSVDAGEEHWQASLELAQDAAQSIQSSRWNNASSDYENAIDELKLIPSDSEFYDKAQEKIEHYGEKIEWAQRKIDQPSPVITAATPKAETLEVVEAVSEVEEPPEDIEEVPEVIEVEAVPEVVETEAPTQQNCHSSYPSVCIPPAPPDLDCGDITHRRFTVSGSDPHRFDGDNDGIGCES